MNVRKARQTMRTKLTVACALTALAAITGRTPQAAGLIDTSGIAKGAVTSNRLAPSVQTMLSVKSHNGTNGDTGKHGVKGSTARTAPTERRGRRALLERRAPRAASARRATQVPPARRASPARRVPRGTPGADGAPGVKGETGAKGATGADGARGTPGAPGKDGSNGVNALGIVVTHVTGGDSSVCGNDWATDTYTRTLQFMPQDDGTIHVIRSYSGTFTTIAGVHGPMVPVAPTIPCRSAA